MCAYERQCLDFKGFKNKIKNHKLLVQQAYYSKCNFYIFPILVVHDSKNLLRFLIKKTKAQYREQKWKPPPVLLTNLEVELILWEIQILSSGSSK